MASQFLTLFILASIIIVSASIHEEEAESTTTEPMGRTVYLGRKANTPRGRRRGRPRTIPTTTSTGSTPIIENGTSELESTDFKTTTPITTSEPTVLPEITDYTSHSTISQSKSWVDDLYDEFRPSIETTSANKTNELLNELENRLLQPNSLSSSMDVSEEISKIGQLLPLVVNSTLTRTIKGQIDIVRRAMKIPGLLIANEDAWKNITNVTQRSAIGYNLLVNVESMLFTLNRPEMKTNGTMNFETTGLSQQSFTASFGNALNGHKLHVIFPDSPSPKDSFIEVTEDVEYFNTERSFVGISIESKYIQDILPTSQMRTHRSKSEGAAKIINSRFISLSLNDDIDSTNHEKGNITTYITFRHEVEAYGEVSQTIRRMLRPGERPLAVQGSATCVYWSPEENLWIDDGCEVHRSSPQATVCKCDHLTSFALIMDVHNYVGKDVVLEMLTFLLCLPSIVCLVACIVIFSYVPAVQNQRNTINKHLCWCLLLGIILVTSLADRGYFSLNQGMCITVGIATHYVYLAAFLWMGIEGVYLYKTITSVFDCHKNSTKLYIIVGYGLPAIVVGTTCTVGYLMGDRPYGNDLYCWLNGTYHWGFSGPAGLITMANIFVLYFTLKTIHKSGSTSLQVKARKRSYRTWIEGSFSITVILGLTWLPGFLVLSNSRLLAHVAAYVFVLLNASQGIFLFVVNCMLNDKVRDAVKRRTSIWLEQRSFSFTRSTESTSGNRKSQWYVSKQESKQENSSNQNLVK